MKPFTWISGVMSCVVALAACTTDAPPADDELTGEATAEVTTPVLVSIPAELTLQPIPGTATGNQWDATTNACRVKLVFCADPRFSPTLPSYCSNGCTFPQDFNAAISLCRSICGNINCNTMWFVGSC